MSVECERQSDVASRRRVGLRRVAVGGRGRALYLVCVNLVAISTILLLSEIGFRLFWNPRYWIHTSRLDVGSGQTEAGKKWWPSTKYTVESSEFRVEFRTNALGYRARPGGVSAPHPFRIAFVGDSFTEAMQVPVESTFCVRLEGLLNRDREGGSRPFVCENFGVSATDLLDYWHRIDHDVLPRDAPDALVLCIYPGNDFMGVLPDEAFDPDGRPAREFFHSPGWAQHLVAWINLHSKFGSYVQRALLSIGARTAPPKPQGPKKWWADPEVAARASDTTAVRRSRALLEAIAEECRRHGTKLTVLVVGPVDTYAAKNGESPLKRIMENWDLDIPVVDVAIAALARPDFRSLTFPIDGHLNEAGHAFVAEQAAPALAAVLAPSGNTASR